MHVPMGKEGWHICKWGGKWGGGCAVLLISFIALVDILVGLLRLRKCSPNTYRVELKGGCSIVRELHVYPPGAGCV